MTKRSVPQAVFESPEAKRAQHQAHKEATEALDRTPPHLLGEGNPNHPKYDGVFGYDREEFLARQYK